MPSWTSKHCLTFKKKSKVKGKWSHGAASEAAVGKLQKEMQQTVVYIV